MSKEDIEKDIHKSLSSLRLKGINTVIQIKRFKMKYSYLINIGKIDINYLCEVYGYNKHYLIKLINDLNFLKDTNLKELYHFSEKGEDPFLLSLSGKSETINNYKKKDSDLEKEYENEFEELESADKKYNSVNENINSDKNEEIIDGKKYKLLPISKELLGVVKNLNYYLNQEKMFIIVRLGEDALNNPDKYEKDFESDRDFEPINNYKNNMITDKDLKEKLFINRSRAIVKLKNNKNKYNQLFFNKTLGNNKINANQNLVFKTEKKNFNKNPIKLQKEFVRKDKKDESKEKINEIKLYDNTIKDEEENSEKIITKEKNYILKMFKKKESKEVDKDKPQLEENKEIKRLVIRTNGSDYWSPNNNIKRESKATLLKKEEEIYNEVEKRVKDEVDKKMKKIEESIALRFQRKLDEDKKRLEKEAKLIEEEKLKIKKYHEDLENRRKHEEEIRQKQEEERKIKEENEQKEKIEKEKIMKEENEKMKKDLEEKFRKEIEERFKKNKEIQEDWEKKEKKGEKKKKKKELKEKKKRKRRKKKRKKIGKKY